MQNESYVWLSLDPVNCVIDFYPREIAYKIEKYYNMYTQEANKHCSLGSSFFNANIYFHSNPDQPYYQTTSRGNRDNSFKQPGYRSVKRITLTPESTHVTILGKKINREWRIINRDGDFEKTFNVEIPEDVIIYPLDVIRKMIKDNQVPIQYLCFISKEIMIDPVKTIDNQIYDRSSIESWFKNNNSSSPVTGSPINDFTLTPQTVLKNEINNYICYYFNFF